VIDADGSYLGNYRKTHIPDDPGFYEKFYFTPGDTGYKVFDTKFAKIGVLICWDQWYPEAARITSLMGAEILFYPTAIGWEVGANEEVNKEQYNAWQLIQRSHAVANGIPVVFANQMGSLLYLASHDKEENHVQEIDLALSDYYRTIWPFLRDRRIDNYAPILSRYLGKP
jgi:N-carbamoylputrescine amidase